jgi:hypothetical protein
MNISNLGGLASLAGNAGAAAAGGGLPWQLILPIAFSFLQSSGLFGGGGDEYGDMMDQARNVRMLMRQLGIQQPYRSPYLPEMDKTVAQAVLNNLRRYSNWGMPEGMTMDTSFIPDLTEMAGFGRGREKIRR